MTLTHEQPEMTPSEVAEDDKLRSQFMQRLIVDAEHSLCTGDAPTPPRVLVQFWDDADSVPSDVQACLDSWAPLESSGFERLLFDDLSAAQFIKKNFGVRHVRAFERCNHPAMRADYFRLCFIMKVGGVYIDADDSYQGGRIEDLISDSCLKIQPLCYDLATGSMVDPVNSAKTKDSEGRIFYVNNNPLIAPPGHPVIERALESATSQLLSSDKNSRDIQSLTGPGNLTMCLVLHALGARQANSKFDFKLIPDWNSVATTEWPLAYRSDHRNWRHWIRGDE